MIFSSLTFQLFTSLSLEIRNRWVRFAVGKKCSQEKKKEVSSIFSPDASHVFGRPGKSRAHMPTKPPLGFQSVCLHLPVITYSTPHDAFSTMIQRENSIIPKESGLNFWQTDLFQLTSFSAFQLYHVFSAISSAHCWILQKIWTISKPERNVSIFVFSIQILILLDLT